MIVDGRVFLDVQFGPGVASVPSASRVGTLFRDVCGQDERAILIDLDAGPKLRERQLVVHPTTGTDGRTRCRASWDRVP